MATRKTPARKRAAGNGKESTGKSSRRKSSSKKFKIILISLLAVLLAGMLFQLNCFKTIGVHLLKHKKHLPRQVVEVLPGSNAVEASANHGETLRGEIIEVYDGDTAVLLMKERNRKYKVRFYGIDAPEKEQPHGIEARDALRQKILGKMVTVEVVNVDAYNRSVGKVIMEGRNINREMLYEGHAWFYKDYAKHEYTFAEAERQARSNYRGLWQSNAPTPPWEYRRKKR